MSKTPHEGFVLMITLCILLMMSAVILTQQARMRMHDTTNALQHQQAISYMDALALLHQSEIQYSLMQSIDTTATNTGITHKILSQNACYSVVLFTVISSQMRTQFVLQSADIFARVPVPKSCTKRPLFARLWWRENPDTR